MQFLWLKLIKMGSSCVHSNETLRVELILYLYVASKTLNISLCIFYHLTHKFHKIDTMSNTPNTICSSIQESSLCLEDQSKYKASHCTSLYMNKTITYMNI